MKVTITRSDDSWDVMCKLQEKLRPIGIVLEEEDSDDDNSYWTIKFAKDSSHNALGMLLGAIEAEGWFEEELCPQTEQYLLEASKAWKKTREGLNGK